MDNTISYNLDVPSQARVVLQLYHFFHRWSNVVTSLLLNFGNLEGFLFLSVLRSFHSLLEYQYFLVAQGNHGTFIEIFYFVTLLVLLVFPVLDRFRNQCSH